MLLAKLNQTTRLTSESPTVPIEQVEPEACAVESLLPQETRVPGNREIGRVLFYKQLHKREGSENNPIRAIPVGRSQEAIVRDILQLNVRHIFDEGWCCSNICLPDTDDRDSKIDREQFLKYFPDGRFPEHLGTKQLTCLAALGAAKICANLDPLLTIHGTSTPEFTALESNITESLDTKGRYIESEENREYYTMHLRERAAARELLEHFSSGHHGETAALIYGANHSFDHAVFSPCLLPTELLPEVVALSTPSLGAWGAARDLAAAETVNAQLQLAQRATFIDAVPDALSKILSDEVLLNVFPKVVVDPAWMDSPERSKEEVQNALLQNTNLTPELVTKLIEDAYSTRTGPFRFLFPAESLEKVNISALRSYEISDLIKNHPDPASCRKIVSEASLVPRYRFDELLNRYAQLEAINKLAFSPGDHHAESPASFADFLLRKAYFTDVKKSIAEQFAASKGPFSPRLWASCVFLYNKSDYKDLSDEAAKNPELQLARVKESTAIPLYWVWSIRGYDAKVLALDKLAREPGEKRSLEEIKTKLIADLTGRDDLSSEQRRLLVSRIERMALEKEGIFEGL